MMKTPKQYQIEAARLRAWALVMFLMVPVAAVLAQLAGTDELPFWWVSGGAGLLLCGAGLRLIARARRQEFRAVVEDHFRSRERLAVSRRHYPPTLAPLGRP